MLVSVSLVTGLLIAWLAVTAIFIILLAVRAIIGLREEDQLFIDPGEERLLKEQREVVAKLERLRPYVLTFLALTIALGLATFGVWVWQQLR